MSQTEDLRAAFRAPDRSSRRERRAKRAQRARKKALSPFRILLRVALIPVVAAGLTISIYVRTSPYDPPDALRHLLAMTGCDAAARLGVAPAFEGELGYHPRNDPDGDGMACGDSVIRPDAAGGFAFAPEASGDAPRSVGGAKFLRP